MECFKYAFNILTVSDGIYSINPGGLQADLMGGSGGAAAPPGNIETGNLLVSLRYVWLNVLFILIHMCMYG